MREVVIDVKNLNKIYKIHEKQEGFKNSVKDFFDRKNLPFPVQKGTFVGF